MEPGDTLTYAGSAVRVVDDAQVQIEGTFIAVEERRDGERLQWLVEDQRTHSGDWTVEDRDQHRYVIPAPNEQQPAAPDEDRPEQ